jgi:hypothetical protein
VPDKESVVPVSINDSLVKKLTDAWPPFLLCVERGNFLRHCRLTAGRKFRKLVSESSNLSSGSRKDNDMFCENCKSKIAHNNKSGLCKKCKLPSKAHAQRINEFRVNRKLECIKYKGGKCQVCGYDKTPWSMCFHHLDPSIKDFTIGNVHLIKWEIVKKELDKCILLCLNCHGEVHAGLLDLGHSPSGKAPDS